MLTHSTRRNNVLCLTGGGYRAYFTACYLAHMEERRERQLLEYYPEIPRGSINIGECFSLIVGTSGGGIIAGGLGAGFNARQIANGMRKLGPRIFNPKAVKNSMWRRLFLYPRYSRSILERSLGDFLDSRKSIRLNDLTKPIALVCVSEISGACELLVSGPLAKSDVDEYSLIQAIAASAAAPTYFPKEKSQRDILLDGGLVANAPELVALQIAIERMGLDVGSVWLLSVGTASPDTGGHFSAQWFEKLPVASHLSRFFTVPSTIIDLTLSAQEKFSIGFCKTLLGHRYTRIDKKPTPDQSGELKKLDNASRAATQLLANLARQAWDDTSRDNIVRSFYE